MNHIGKIAEMFFSDLARNSIPNRTGRSGWSQRTKRDDRCEQARDSSNLRDARPCSLRRK